MRRPLHPNDGAGRLRTLTWWRFLPTNPNAGGALAHGGGERYTHKAYRYCPSFWPSVGEGEATVRLGVRGFVRQDPMTSATSAPNSFAQAAEATAKPSLAAIFDLVRQDFDRVNEMIPRQLSSRIPLVEEIGRYIVEGGGKRLRPLIVLLVAHATRFRGSDHIRLATVIEFLHTATLLHDDMVDNSSRRRGRATANARWGNAASVLVGDFLYSRGFQLMVQLGNAKVMAIIADATNVIAEGEVMQLACIGKAAMLEDEYLEVVRRKTAMLFQASAHTGAVLCADDADTIDALRRYGLHFGMAYQLVDDWLDYAGDSELMGKNAGDDLAEGKVTLPLIHAMGHGCSADARLVQCAIETRSARDFHAVAAAVERSGGLAYTRQCAIEQADLALAQMRTLPPSPYRDALGELATFAVSRLI